MIASSSNNSSRDITDTTYSGDTGYLTYYDHPYVKEEEIEEEIVPPKVESFKTIRKNIVM